MRLVFLRPAGARLWLAALLILIGFAPVSGAQITKISQHPVPASIPWPMDLRLTGEDSVMIAGGVDGIFRLDLGTGAHPRLLVSGEEATYVSRLGASGDWLAAGTTFGPLGWMPRGSDAGYQVDVPMAVILDLDVRGDQVWMLGSRRTDEGEFAPEGAILWSAELTADGLEKLAPRMFAESGPGAKEMAYCYILETGAVRSLGEDRWVVVPGVQPGVFVYDGAGELVRAWQSEDLGFVDECGLTRKEFLQVNGELEPRNAWLNRRRVVDDVVAWDGDPVLIVRQVSPEGPRWHLLRLGDGEPERLDLPLAAGTNARLKADLAGDRLVVLVTEYERQPEDRSEPPKLAVFRLPKE